MSYQFGVWQPPSGMESVQRSRQLPFESIVSRSPFDLQQIDSRIDLNQGSIERVNLDTDSITQRNNPIYRFEEMLFEGWGGGVPVELPSFAPSPSPSSYSFSHLPLGNLNAGQIDRAMSAKACENFCVALYNLWEGQWSTQQICWTENEGWISDTWNDGQRHNTLDSWYQSFYWNSTGMPEDYFEVDEETRSVCFPPITSFSTLPPREFTAADIDLAMSEW
jgi:hypothetical protein